MSRGFTIGALRGRDPSRPTRYLSNECCHVLGYGLRDDCFKFKNVLWAVIVGRIICVRASAVVL